MFCESFVTKLLLNTRPKIVAPEGHMCTISGKVKGLGCGFED